MSLPLLIFGLVTDSLLAVLVGLVGARRRIGFGWAFLLSAISTPLVGLICCLISDKLPDGDRKWGCLGTLLGIMVIVAIFGFCLSFFALL